jgi:hypothetical protein
MQWQSLSMWMQDCQTGLEVSKNENIFKDKFSHLKVDNDHLLWHKLREKNKPFFIFVLTLLGLTSHERF